MRLKIAKWSVIWRLKKSVYYKKIEVDREEVQMKKEEIQYMAFEMIADAGNAMNSYYTAMIHYHHQRIHEAEQALQEGNDFLVKTHQIQTTLIQAEVNQEEIPYSLVMTHAQDHLTNAINWQRLSQLFIQGLKKGEENDE